MIPREYCNVVQFARRDGLFWNTLAPGMTAYVTLANRSLSPWQIKTPLKECNRRRAFLLGHATDYLAGLLLTGSIAPTIISHVFRVATNTPGEVDDWKIPAKFYIDLTENLCGRENLLHPVANWRHPRILGLTLLSLAQVEVVSRSELTEYLPPLHLLPPSRPLAGARRWLSGHVDGDLVDEWLELAKALQRLLLPLRASRKILYNPVTGRYGRLGGSDADLYVDGTLYDLKTTVNGRIAAAYLRQLLAYVAINRLKNAMPPVEAVGLIFTRQEVSWQTPVISLCRATGIGSVTRLTAAVKARLLQEDLAHGLPEPIANGGWQRPRIASYRLHVNVSNDIKKKLLALRESEWVKRVTSIILCQEQEGGGNSLV